MNSRVLRFGIIGTGAILNHHLRSIQSIKGCELVALCSSSENRAQLVEAQFGIKTYWNYQRMFKEVALDVVCILTSSGNHLEPTLAAAKSGVHVITEKPLEVSLDRADEMIAACKAANVKLACIFQNRYTKDFQILKKAIETGALGRLLLGNAYIKWYRDEQYYQSSHWKGTIAGDGGAAFINQGIHTIDLLIHLIGEVSSVYGQVRTMIHNIEGEDVGQALLTFESGALGSIQAGTALYPGYPERLEIYGTQGSVILEGGKIIAWNVKGITKEIEEVEMNSGANDPMAIDYKLHLAQIEEIVNDIRSDRSPRVSGEEARKSLALIQAVYDSSRKGAIIKIN